MPQNPSLQELVAQIRTQRCEGQTLEVKAAHDGTPKVYDTISSFSNQMSGGTIVFGIDESSDFAIVGVGDAQRLQKDIAEQCKEMTPQVRAFFEIASIDGKLVVSARIEGQLMSARPVFRTTTGITKGSFVRVGDQDLRMGPSELYEIEAFKAGTRDDATVSPLASRDMLDASLIEKFLFRAREGSGNLARRPTDEILSLTGAVRKDAPTLAGLMVLGDYPQQVYPNLCITAVAISGTEFGQDEDGSRFIDNKRLDGDIEQMIEGAIAFVRRNTKTRVRIVDGVRTDVPEYPENAVREIVINSLMHRDFGPYNNGTPTRLSIFSDRIECWNPGGVYGGQSVEDLGYTNVQTRNPTLVSLLEIQGIAENRHSGIPVVRDAMARAGLKPPVFIDRRGTFTAVLYNHPEGEGAESAKADATPHKRESADKPSFEAVIEFCSVPRSRGEVAEHFGISAPYAAQRFLNPLVELGRLSLTIPEKPRSSYQRFVRANPSA